MITDCTNILLPNVVDRSSSPITWTFLGLSALFLNLDGTGEPKYSEESKYHPQGCFPPARVKMGNARKTFRAVFSHGLASPLPQADKLAVSMRVKLHGAHVGMCHQLTLPPVSSKKL